MICNEIIRDNATEYYSLSFVIINNVGNRFLKSHLCCNCKQSATVWLLDHHDIQRAGGAGLIKI